MVQKILFKSLFSAVAVLVLSACSYIPPSQYFTTSEVGDALRRLPPVKLEVASVQSSVNISMACRGMVPIPIAGNLTLPDFIKGAFNQEFMAAGFDSFAQSDGADDGVKLEIDIKLAEFASMARVTNGWWAFLITVRNPATGYEYDVAARYDFATAYDGVVACTNTGLALTPSVQKLVQTTVSNEKFF